MPLLTILETSKIRLHLLFEPRDLWVGLYWNNPEWPNMPASLQCFRFYLCVIPTLPLRLEVYP